MNDFKKNNSFRGGGDRGGNFSKGNFNRPSFGGDRGFKGGNRDSGRSSEMFQAVCASCNKTCEVPFRPNGKKPVYCKECFAKNGGPTTDSRGSSDRFTPRRDFAPAPSYKPEHRTENKPEGDRGMGELKRSIEALNSKLDKIVQILSEKAPAQKPVKSPLIPVVSVSKTPAKKVIAKKKVAPKKKK